jgi:hypothetical protein
LPLFSFFLDRLPSPPHHFLSSSSSTAPSPWRLYVPLSPSHLPSSRSLPFTQQWLCLVGSLQATFGHHVEGAEASATTTWIVSGHASARNAIIGASPTPPFIESVGADLFLPTWFSPTSSSAPSPSPGDRRPGRAHSSLASSTIHQADHSPLQLRLRNLPCSRQGQGCFVRDGFKTGCSFCFCLLRSHLMLTFFLSLLSSLPLPTVQGAHCLPLACIDD